MAVDTKQKKIENNNNHGKEEKAENKNKFDTQVNLEEEEQSERHNNNPEEQQQSIKNIFFEIKQSIKNIETTKLWVERHLVKNKTKRVEQSQELLTKQPI